MTKLLRIPTLRFTPDCCQVVANILSEGAAITNLEFSAGTFPSGECATIMANGLTRNTYVISISVLFVIAPELVSALATALLSNSTLRELMLSGCWRDEFSPVLLALEKNTALQTLYVDAASTMDEIILCTAIKDGLRMNSTLESLHLSFSLDLNNTALWCGALSFLRTNRALKSLSFTIHYGSTSSCISSFRMDVAAMLEVNVSLERLSISSWLEMQPEEYAALLIRVLQHNKTLKTLNFLDEKRSNSSLQLTPDGDKHMALLLQKNYGLESLPNIDLENQEGDFGAILRLNGAGRRHLIEDGSSISRGVEVLSTVMYDTNCVFLHLLENPGLCDRRAVEKASDSADSTRGPRSPANRYGKQDQDQALGEGKECHGRHT